MFLIWSFNFFFNKRPGQLIDKDIQFKLYGNVSKNLLSKLNQKESELEKFILLLTFFYGNIGVKDFCHLLSAQEKNIIEKDNDIM